MIVYRIEYRTEIGQPFIGWITARKVTAAVSLARKAIKRNGHVYRVVECYRSKSGRLHPTRAVWRGDKEYHCYIPDRTRLYELLAGLRECQAITTAAEWTRARNRMLDLGLKHNPLP